jgi:hypothetical protein
MKTPHLLCGSLLFLVLCHCAYAQQPPNESEYVSRKEYEALKKELDELKAKFAAFEEQTSSDVQTQQKLEALAQELTAVKTMAAESVLGETKLLIAGDADMGFTNLNDTDSSFSASFNPMLLWQLNERLFFEGALEMELSGPDDNGDNSDAEAELDSAYLTYIVNDSLAVGGGLFPVPFTAYHNHFDPSWINKLPTDPLVYGDNGLAPDSAVGVFATGARPVGKHIINYAAWVTNGPALITEDPDAAGSFNFDNYNDQNNNKAVGGRIGWLPTPALEIGYSVQCAKASPDNFESLHAIMQGVDLNYVKTIDRIKGRLTSRAAWVWSRVDEATYDPMGEFGFGPLRFDNNRDGGYLEVAYRPTEADDEALRDFEFVMRYDRLNVSSNAPGGGNRTQWTPGIDYWLAPRTVLKTAYVFDNWEHNDDQSGFLVQLATGF